MADFKYDVAISFLHEDQPATMRLVEAASSLSVFVFPQRQIDLVTQQDGLTAFSEVFVREARTIAIMHREKWSTTDWTRLESNAIKDRFLRDGPEIFTLFKLDDTPAPIWFPRHRIWADYARMSAQTAAAILEERVRSAGGIVRTETAVELAARLAKRDELALRKSNFLNTPAAAAAAKEEFARLRKVVREQGEMAGFRCEYEGDFKIWIHRHRWSVEFLWQGFRNTAKDSVLHVREWKQNADSASRKQRFGFDVELPTESYGWREEHTDRFYGTAQLVDEKLRDIIARNESDRQREESSHRRGPRDPWVTW